ncbi:hypothetical protein GCM10027321_18620 [Massilia terrae]|uniref:Phasin family protein n=1 Tax=Massilia terrae TaxID=1811224 RepID=A0ABT2CWG7_9BURK|nr:phasin family protein [Massilia terrae]MCS0658323.1 phasin family protein [Massilia terrae]
MISLPEQFSAARKAQVDSQIEFMRALTARAVATAEQVLALNINASRESVTRTANTVRQLCAITDPRDLFTLGAQTQEQLSSLYNYGRELFNIAADARLDLGRRIAAHAAPQPQAKPAQAVAPAAEPAAAQASAPAAEAAPETVAPVVEEEQPEVAQTQPAPPRAKAKPIARAVGKVVYAPAELPHPSAAPIIEEVGTTSEGVIEVKPRQPRAAKAQRKK